MENKFDGLEKRFAGLENRFDEFESNTDRRFKGLQYWFALELDKQIKPLEERILNIPSKEDYFNSMDTLIKEIQEYRVERVTLGSQVDRLKQRVDNVEAKVGIQNE